MNISLNWLATHLDLSGKSIKEIDDLFTFAGVEVEGIVSKGIASEKIVVAQIMEAVQHPNADQLKVTQVDAGEGTLRQIVCGAQNYKVGDKVPCCLPGAELPGGFTIGETVMRKVESKGMLAAAAEIGLPAGEDGLLILPEDAPIGKPVKELFDSDTLLELEVTPNRPDLLSHYGMARELATLLKTPLKPLNERPGRLARIVNIQSSKPPPPARSTPPSASPASPSRNPPPGSNNASNPSACARSTTSSMSRTSCSTNSANRSTPSMPPNSPATSSSATPTDGETFLALDESEHTLTTDDLLISDESGAALALAGVMGGLTSGVTETTTDILLESAYFTPQGIRRTSRRTALSSDSSYRFERGVDPQGVLTASAFAVKLILEVAGGTAETTTQVAGEAPVLTKPVALDAAKLDQLMGGSISLTAAEEILTRLGLTKLADGTWDVPSFRADLQRHIDLVEEIARVHGLANVPSRFLGAFVPASGIDAAYDADMVLRRRLAALGVYECQTIKLISDAQVSDALPLRPLQDGDIIRVKLPLSEDHAVMRPSLVPGLVASAARNVRQQAKSLRFFEMGRAFRNAGGGKAKDQESETLAILLSGGTAPAGLEPSRPPSRPLRSQRPHQRARS